MSVTDIAVSGLQKGQGLVNVKETVLIISTEMVPTQPLATLLQQSGIETAVSNSAVKAFDEARRHVPSLVVIYRNSVAYMELQYSPKLRSIPVAVFYEPEARCEEDDCIKALDDGAAATICNSTYREIVARIRAILRRERHQRSYQKIHKAGSVMMNLETHEVSVDDVIVDLTLKEFTLLQVFLESPGRVLPRQELLDRVWGKDYALDEHALDVHVHNLRRKIESCVSPHLIMTVRGIGYKLCESRETGKLDCQRKDPPSWSNLGL